MKLQFHWDLGWSVLDLPLHWQLMPGDQTWTLDCNNPDEWKPICVLTDHNYSLPIVKLLSQCVVTLCHIMCVIVQWTRGGSQLQCALAILFLGSVSFILQGIPWILPKKNESQTISFGHPKLLSWYFVTLYIWGQHSFDTSSWLHFIFTGETPVKLEVNMIEAPSASPALVCLLTPSP